VSVITLKQKRQTTSAYIEFISDKEGGERRELHGSGNPNDWMKLTFKNQSEWTNVNPVLYGL